MTKQSVKAPGPMVELRLFAYVIREIKSKNILVLKMKALLDRLVFLSDILQVS